MFLSSYISFCDFLFIIFSFVFSVTIRNCLLHVFTLRQILICLQNCVFDFRNIPCHAIQQSFSLQRGRTAALGKNPFSPFQAFLCTQLSYSSLVEWQGRLNFTSRDEILILLITYTLSNSRQHFQSPLPSNLQLKDSPFGCKKRHLSLNSHLTAK